MTGVPVLIRIRLGLGLAVVGVFGYAAWAATDLNGIARPFPLSVAVAGLVFAVAGVAVDVVRWRRGESLLGTALETTAVVRESSDDTDADSGSAALRAMYYLLLVTAYLICVWLAGIYVASALLLVYFGRREARQGWLGTLLMSAIVLAALAAVTRLLDLALPPSLIGW